MTTMWLAIAFVCSAASIGAGIVFVVCRARRAWIPRWALVVWPVASAAASFVHAALGNPVRSGIGLLSFLFAGAAVLLYESGRRGEGGVR